jgi:hypothetical protein
MSAYFTNRLTPPTSVGLLDRPAGGSFLLRSAWPGRSQKDGLPCEGWHGTFGFKAINSRTGRGSLIAAPFSRDRNGREENTGPCFARRVVDLLRRLSLDYGSLCFHLGLCRARYRRRSRRRSPEASALTMDQMVGVMVLNLDTLPDDKRNQEERRLLARSCRENLNRIGSTTCTVAMPRHGAWQRLQLIHSKGQTS